jgi:hypothetical protein
VHDVGKLEVPAKLLNKPGKPTEEEWETLRQHPQAGADLTQPLAHWLGPYSVVAVQHHERYDGTGYPAGLRGHEISLGARIVGLADAFEVMTASRPYKRAMTRSVALQEVIRCAGTQFDPVVTRAFLAVSMPRLRRALGPASLVGQLPVIVTSPATSIPVLASGAARGASTAVATGIAGAAVVASGVAGVTATAPTSGANQHSNSTVQHAGSATQGHAAQAGAGMVQPEVGSDPANTVASVPSSRAPSPSAPPSPLSVTTVPAATPTADGGAHAVPPTRGSTIAHHLLPALPVASALPVAIPALTNPALPLDVLLPSALPTQLTDPIESVVNPPIAAVVSALPVLGFLGQ